MKKTIIALLMLVMALKSINIALGQCESVFFRSKKIELKGVSNIRRIAQDGYGFLWLATQDGMFRYDSKNNINYNTNQNIAKQLETSDIRDILIDSLNHICWFISSGGHLYGINLSTGNITIRASLQFSEKNVPVFFHRMIKYQNSLLFASNKGVWIYDIKQNHFSLLELKVLKNEDVDDIVNKNDDLIIFSKTQGILQYNFKSKRVMTVIKSKELLKGREIRFFEALVQGNNIYCGTEDGLLRLIFHNDIIKADVSCFSFLPAQVNNKIAGLCFDQKGVLWFSNETQVIKADLVRQKTEIIKSEKVEDGEWLTSVFNIFCDKDNNIWLGSQSGMTFLKNASIEFHSFGNYAKKNIQISHAYYIWPANDSVFYVCGENGLFYLNIFSKEILLIDGTRAYDYIFKDPNNRLIVSNVDGLFVLENNRFQPIGSVYKEFFSLGSIRINSSVESGDTSLVFGTENYKGVLEWKYKINQVMSYTVSSPVIKLNENVTNCLKKDGDNIFLLGDSYFGLINMANRNYNEIALQTHEKKRVSLFFDLCRLNGNYYLAAYGFGVLVLNEKFQVIDRLSSGNGLTNNGVYKLLPWRDSLLFITTNNGLNIYNTKSKKIKTYYESDGLHNSQFEETSGNFLNDKIFAGGKNGVTVIYPLNLKANLDAPSFFYGKISIETSGGYKVDTFNVTASQYTITNTAIQTAISFHAINYSNPERTTYQYRILEQSSNWIDLNTQNFITLIGLSPGTYHLQVKAANEDGVWSEPKELILIFLPKWYQTWWFYTLIVLAVAAILYALYRYRINQIKKQHQIRKNIATDLHDDLGSTLNSVKVFTNLAISGVKQEESLQQVKDNLTEATMSLRDMIWVLDDSLDTVDELVTRLKQFAIPITAACNMEFVINAGSDVNSHILTKEEKRNLFLICKEAINNSIKYSGAAQITVDITPAGKKIQITVADDGKGFDDATVKKGYGLKNMQYRAGQVRYKIQLTSLLGKGTKIFILPF